MIYRSDDIPEGYNNIAEISDNYLVWVRESRLNSGTSYSAYYQFIKPSVSVLFTDNYKISTGTSYILDANYVNNGVYQYLDSYDVVFSRDTIEVSSEDISSNDFDRGDMPSIFICQFICCIFFVWMLNQLSKLIKKDGGFH